MKLVAALESLRLWRIVSELRERRRRRRVPVNLHCEHEDGGESDHGSQR